MTSAEQLAGGRYLALTTYERSGEPVPARVWVVPVSDGRLGSRTAMGTGTTTRLHHDPRVQVEPCDARGRTAADTSPVHGRAEMVRSGALFDEVQGRVREKYGLVTTLTRVLTRVLTRLGPQGRRHLTYADTVVLVRLEEPAQDGTSQDGSSQDGSSQG